MADTVFKQKILEKTTHKVANQPSSFGEDTLQGNASNQPAHENCISDQGDRGRVIIFIDGSNLFYAASYLNIEIDFAKLLEYLTAKDYLVHVFFYTGYDPTNEKQKGFLQWLNHRGFRVIAKAVTQATDGAKSANLDVEIAVDMMRLARYCDTAVLVSGDGDFVYVVNMIARQGVRVEVVGLRSMTSSSLIDVANCYIDLAVIQETVQKLDDKAI